MHAFRWIRLPACYFPLEIRLSYYYFPLEIRLSSYYFPLEIRLHLLRRLRFASVKPSAPTCHRQVGFKLSNLHQLNIKKQISRLGYLLFW